MSLLVSLALPLAVAMTGKVAAAGRAPESQRPDRLFDDPYAALLAGADRFRWMSDWRLPGMPAENPVIAGHSGRRCLTMRLCSNSTRLRFWPASRSSTLLAPDPPASASRPRPT